MEGRFMFQWGGGEVCFSDRGGGFIFKWGVAPHGGHRFWWRRFSKKIGRWVTPLPPPPTMGNPEMVVMTSLDANYGFEDFF